MDISLPQEELTLDPVKGYPRGYERLSRLAALHTGVETIGCHRGPPYIWTPVDDPEVTAAALKIQQQFPLIAESQRERKSVAGFEGILWSRLRPCLGFDPDLLRVDKFGNVIHRHAAPNTILAGCVDHYYPVARGGLTTVDNLQLIQWQANANKKEHLEFTIPWWDLMVGVSVAQLIRLISAVDTPMRTMTLQTLFPKGAHEPLVCDFKLHPEGRSKMIAMAMGCVNDTRTRKEALVNAKVFWQLPGKLDALKAAVSIYGQNWATIWENCQELQLLQTSQLKDKWKSVLRGDQNLAGISSPGRRGRPSKLSPSPNCLRETDGNTLPRSGEYSEALARVEVERAESAAAEGRVESASRALCAVHHQLRCLEDDNKNLDRRLATLLQRQEESELEIISHREYGEQVLGKLAGAKKRVKELLGLCAVLRDAKEGLSASVAAEESKAVVLRRSKARLETEISALRDRFELSRIEVLGAERKEAATLAVKAELEREMRGLDGNEEEAESSFYSAGGSAS